MEERLKMKDNKTKGYILVLIAATCASLGQLLWKFAAETSGLPYTLFTIIGYVLAAAGMFILMASFAYGEVSVLQPMMSIGFAFSVFLGFIFLHEPITLAKILGVIFIVAGTIVLSRSPEETKDTTEGDLK